MGIYPVQVVAVPGIVSASIAAVPTTMATAIRTPNTSANGDVGAVRESERDGNGMRRTSGIESANELRGEAEMICQSGIRIRGHGVGGKGKVLVVAQGTRAGRRIHGERAAMLMLIGLNGRECNTMNMPTKDDDVELRGLRKGAPGTGRLVRLSKVCVEGDIRRR